MLTLIGAGDPEGGKPMKDHREVRKVVAGDAEFINFASGKRTAKGDIDRSEAMRRGNKPMFNILKIQTL